MKQKTRLKTHQSFEEDVKQGKIWLDEARLLEEFVKTTAIENNWIGEQSKKRTIQSVKPFLIELKTRGWKLSTLTSDQLTSLREYLNNKEEWSEPTRESNWDRFSRFFKFIYLKNKAKVSLEVRHSLIGGEYKRRTRYKVNHHKLRGKCRFTPEEMVFLVSREKHLNYKALWATGFEGGFRISEIKGIKHKDVKIEPSVITFDITQSKTAKGKREVYVTDYFYPVVLEFLQRHPTRNDPEAQVFINLYGDPIGETATNQRLQELTREFLPELKDINNLSWHSLRHSRATELASVYTEMELRKYFGWTKSSRMPQVYVDLAKLDTKKRLLVARGKDTDSYSKVADNKCYTCEAVNPVGSYVCHLCKNKLDPVSLVNEEPLSREDIIKKAVKDILQDIGYLKT